MDSSSWKQMALWSSRALNGMIYVCQLSLGASMYALGVGHLSESWHGILYADTLIQASLDQGGQWMP